jgi:hypothetical protein
MISSRKLSLKSLRIQVTLKTIKMIITATKSKMRQVEMEARKIRKNYSSTRKRGPRRVLTTSSARLTRKTSREKRSTSSSVNSSNR